MSKPLIEFSNFTFQYRAQAEPTLRDINLSVFPGEKVLIVGPSGSGKSTLAHCMNGMIPFNYRGTATGMVRVDGRETNTLSLFEISKIVGTVLQDPDGQFVGLTAGEDIAFSLENDCVPQAEMWTRVREAAARVGIDQALDKSPYDLSGGQKQRVSMAGVLINDVQMLLFDEPLANLDPATGRQTIDLIDTLTRRKEATVVIIEHRLEDVLYRQVDRVILIENGSIVADLSPDALVSGSLLKSSGIREPLYITALKYAGVAVAPEMKPGRMDTLRLNEDAVRGVRRWLAETNPAPSPKQTEPLLRAEDISFAYEPGHTVLDSINFTIHRGEMAAIVGANGAGKSTLAKLICGFEKPGSGRFLLRNQDLASETIASRAAHIGYVMQNPNQMISEPMILDEVTMGLRSRNMPEAEIAVRAEETLRICGLYPMRNWPISALSFGQKKRVTIASVLVMQPEIILLDEPTAGQDFRHYTEIMEFLRSLNRQGVTVLMITHDMHLMLEYAQRALVLCDGGLMADCAPSALLCDAPLAAKASLKETSLFQLAQRCGIADGAGFVQHFIDYDREVRGDG